MFGKREILVLLSAFLVYRTYYSPKPLSLTPIVRTELGDLQGIKSISRDGREYFEYLGIPYAKPPVGPLRFEAPEEVEKWDGVLKAVKYGNECSQMQLIFGNMVGEEDCLFLNVFTPKRKQGFSGLMPVMVFVHGGHFMEGSGNMFRPDYFMDEDVVLVTLNYRLAALGFLSTGDGVIAGNAGLKDQSMALKWVQKNIAQFGGDPKKVTLFGESAGGASVHFHMISSASQGLFQKAISQSGNTRTPWTLNMNDPKDQSERFSRRLNCPTSSTKEMIECLKTVDVKDIIETHQESRDSLKDLLATFLPTVEVIKDKNAFLPEHPLELLKKAKAGIPWMTGVNQHEGLIFVVSMARNASLEAYLSDSDNWLQSMSKLLFIKDLTPDKAKELRRYYFGKDSSLDFQEHFDNYTTMFSDVLFNQGFSETVRLHAKHSPVYAYLYNYPGEFSLYNVMLAIRGAYPTTLELLGYVVTKWVNKNIFGTGLPHYGVCHFDEMGYLFKLEMMHEITKDDKGYGMSKKMVKLWTDFAKDETNLEYGGLEWKPFDPNNRDSVYFEIGETGRYITNPFNSRLKFLQNTIFKP